MGNDYSATISPQDCAVEHALERIERELGHRMDAVERVAVTRVLEELGDAWAYHRRERLWRDAWAYHGRER
jgi:hypothetical protein